MARYQEIREDIRRKIATGEWPPGGQIPSLRELCELYSATGTMIRQSLEQLQTDGYIVSRQGVGSWVADPVPQRPRRSANAGVSIMVRVELTDPDTPSPSVAVATRDDLMAAVLPGVGDRFFPGSLGPTVLRYAGHQVQVTMVEHFLVDSHGCSVSDGSRVAGGPVGMVVVRAPIVVGESSDPTELARGLIHDGWDLMPGCRAWQGLHTDH